MQDGRPATLSPLTANSSRLAFLDALRGWAAVWVTLDHMIWIPSPALSVPGWAALAKQGGLGVSLFFVVSAFSLCYTMPRHLARPQPLRSFYFSRFFRIAPLFYFILVVYFFRDRWFYETTHGFSEVLQNFTFVFNLVPGRQQSFVMAAWTIGVEMLFYALFPFIYRFSGNLWRALGFLFLVILFANFAKFALTQLPVDPVAYYRETFIRHLPIFACGIAAFYATRLLQQRTDLRSLGFALATFAFVALYDLNPPFIDSHNWNGVIFSVLLLGLWANPLPVLTGKVICYLGRISYSLYLLHPLAIFTLKPAYRAIYEWTLPLDLKFLVCAILTLGLVVGCASVTYFLIELPGENLGKYIIKRGKSGSVRASPSP